MIDECTPAYGYKSEPPRCASADHRRSTTKRRDMLTRDLISNTKALLVICGIYIGQAGIDDTTRLWAKTSEIIDMLEEEMHCD